MRCSRYRNALIGHAAGSAATALLEAHLELCAECRADLAARRQALDQVDQALASLGEVMPRAGFESRLRAAVEAHAAVSNRRPMGWLPGLAAAAAVVSIGILLLIPRAPHKMPEVIEAPSASMAVAEANRPSARASAEPAVTAPVAKVAATAPARKPRAQQNTEPKVLVPAGEMRALQQWVALMNREQRASSLLAAADAAVNQHAILNIEIRPIEFVPLDAPTNPGT